METQSAVATIRRPRFSRASEPPPFRLTDDDVEIVRQIARYRFLRSTHVAALIGRSLDRTNDRLAKLFHTGYLDRPRAQLDYYPTAGSAPIAYTLADRGARLLADRYGIAFSNPEWSRRNREAGRPFIDRQLAVTDFYVALQSAAREQRQHERCFGWKSFRVLTITTDNNRLRSMTKALRGLCVPHSPGPSLFLFATRAELSERNPLTQTWIDGNGCRAALI